jgi:hypothetical protein
MVMISSADRAGSVLKRGGTVLLIKSTGPGAAGLLIDAVSKMRIEE